MSGPSHAATAVGLSILRSSLKRFNLHRAVILLGPKPLLLVHFLNRFYFGQDGRGRQIPLALIIQVELGIARSRYTSGPTPGSEEAPYL